MAKRKEPPPAKEQILAAIDAELVRREEKIEALRVARKLITSGS